MLNTSVKKMLPLYIAHTVWLYWKDGSLTEGELLKVENDRVFVEVHGKDQIFLVDELEDVRYVGEVTDFHSTSDTGEIDKVYAFHVSECTNLNKKHTGYFMKYNERRYKISCHLVIDTDVRSKLMIKATDVHMEEYLGHVFSNVLTQVEMLYFMCNGERKIGKLQPLDDEESKKYDFVYQGVKRCTLESKEIESVTKCPKINDYVTVIKTNGDECKGLVCAVKEMCFYIFNRQEEVEKIQLEELEQLRFHGVVTENSNNKQLSIDKKYGFRNQYIKDWSQGQRLAKDMEITYIVGVNETRGLFAKEIVVKQIKEKDYKFGLIFTYPGKKNSVEWKGRIGKDYAIEYCLAGAKPAAEAVYDVNVWNGFLKAYREKYPILEKSDGKIFAVQYATQGVDDNGCSIVREMKLLESVEVLDKSVTGIAKISVEGEISHVPLYRAGIQHYVDNQVEIIYENDSSCYGTITQLWADGNGFTVDGIRKIEFKDIKDIRLIGTVDKYYEMTGTANIRVPKGEQYFYHPDNTRRDFQRVEAGKKASFLVKYNGHDSNKNKDLMAGKDVVEVTVFRMYAVGYQKEKGIAVIPARTYELYEHSQEIELTWISCQEEVLFDALENSDIPIEVLYYVNRKEGFERKIYRGFSYNLEMAKEKKVLYKGEIDNNLVGKLKVESAYAIDYREEQENGLLIIDEKNYRLRWLNCQFFSKKELEKKEYLVQIVSDASGNEILMFNKEKSRDKVFYFGYVSTYMENLQYGFITPAGSYGKFTREERARLGVDIYFSASLLAEDDANKPKEWNTFNEDYLVIYSGVKVENKKKNAGMIRFLETIKKMKSGQKEMKLEAISSFAKEIEPEFAQDETVVYLNEENKWVSGNYIAESEDKTSIVLSNRAIVKRGDYYRFGLLTGLETQRGCINNKLVFEFSEDIVEGAMHKTISNEWKNQPKKRLVAYRCSAEGKVTNVEQPKKFMNEMIWEKGVIAAISGNNCVEVTVENRIAYFYKTTETSIVNTMAKGNDFIGRSVYLRKIVCPYWDGDGIVANYCLAAEMQPEKDKCRIEEQKNGSLKAFYGNSTEGVEVENAEELREGEITTVYFHLNNSKTGFYVTPTAEDPLNSAIEDLVEEMTGKEFDIVLDAFMKFADNPGNKKILNKREKERLKKIGILCKNIKQDATKLFGDRRDVLLELRKDILRSVSSEKNTNRLDKLFLEKNIYTQLLDGVERELDVLYKNSDYYPAVECFPNKNTIVKTQKELYLVLSNGVGDGDSQVEIKNDDEAFESRQAAKSVNIIWKSEKLDIEDNNRVMKTLYPGFRGIMSCAIPVSLENIEDTEFDLQWKLEYTYSTGFNTEGEITKTYESEWKQTTISIIDEVKKNIIKSPYSKAAKGEAVGGGKSNVFYGRGLEKDAIREYIVNNETGKMSIEDGKGEVVFVCGQKRCGKSSLVDRMFVEMARESEVETESKIIPKYGVILLKLDFSKTYTIDTFQSFLQESIRNTFLEAIKEAKAMNISLSTKVSNDTLIEEASKDGFDYLEFHKNSEYKTVLYIDEFTTLCARILDAERTLKNLEDSLEAKNRIIEVRGTLDVVDELSQKQFIQIIVGHETMYSMLKSMKKTNDLLERHSPVKVFELDPKSASEVIINPTNEAFSKSGIEPYKSVLGAKAVQRMIFESGQNAFILTKLCHKVYNWFAKSGLDCIVESDVNSLIKDLINTMDITTFGEYFGMLYNVQGNMNSQDTYNFLRILAEKSDVDKGILGSSLEEFLREEGWSESKFQDMVKDLVERHVIAIDRRGRIRIRVALFVKWVKKNSEIAKSVVTE